MEKYEDTKKNIRLIAEKLNIGEDVHFGKDIDVSIRGTFSISNYSVLGNNVQIRGNNISFGKHLFNSTGLRVGGGGRQHPNANLIIGDRCTIHNNFINVCEPVEIGDDVGLSPDTDIITHGYWLSVLEGFPAAFKGVKIGNGVIIGYRSIILIGVEITDFAVIGANTVVTKNLERKGIYAGIPAKFIKEIKPLTLEEKIPKLNKIVESYYPIAKYHGLNPHITIDYPKVRINGFEFNVETFQYEGDEDEASDDLRDYIRKWGIRIYTKRPFKSVFRFD